MKFLLLFFLCAMSVCSLAQSQLVLLKKHGIKKVTTITKEDGVENKTTITYHDDNGNDTSTYMYGKRYQHAVVTYNKQGKITKKETFWDDGSAATTYTYSYNKNGSYKVDNAYPGSTMKSTTLYNAKGHVIKVQVPDGSIRAYTNDAKGNVIKIQTVAPGKKAKLETAKHKFDKTGRVIETLWSDGSKYSYKYNERGLLVESTTDMKGNEDLAEYKATHIYQYE